MSTNDTNPTGDDAPITEDHIDPENGAQPEFDTTVDVRVPTEIAEVVAQRAARRATQGARSRPQRV
jgi:hypothetical protein